MNLFRFRSNDGIAWLLAGLCAVQLASAAWAGPTHGAAATGHPIATAAALDALSRGGNAVDAAIAAAITLGVVDGHNSGIGGGCFMLIRLADGRIVALDGRETAPAAAHRDLFLRHGKVVPALSQVGALAVGVPGALAAYDHALTRFGRLTWADHLERAAQLAERGFVVTRSYAARLAETAPDLRRFPSSRTIFLRPDGRPRQLGERLRQTDLAATYRAIARHGPRWFYEGPFARATERWMRKHGGLMTRQDFAEYRVAIRDPVRTTYRDWDIVGFPPPSSGGVHVAQILNILERFDLEALGPNSADLVHLTAEAMKRAFADRAHWLGDPAFARVPTGLVSKDYAATLAEGIRLERASPVPGHGTPADAATRVFGGHTTHFSTADADGNWVACTATLNTSFGAKVVIPGTGVMMNNQMDDFAAQPGVPNYFGLVGADANAVAPGKRPLSSMSPTLVLREGRPVLALGASGGPTIISQTLMVLIHVLDCHRPLDEALAQPRFHHQWRPDELRVEPVLPESVRAELERRGHRVVVAKDPIAATQAVAQDPGAGAFHAAADPRGSGSARTR